MKRYIFDKAGLAILNLTSKEALTVLSSNLVITNEVLHFLSADLATAVLTDIQVKELMDAGIECHEENRNAGSVLTDSLGPLKGVTPPPPPPITPTESNKYEKVRTGYLEFLKTVEPGSLGQGIKVAILGSGSNLPYDFGYDFISPGTVPNDVYGHDTMTSSMIKGTIPSTGYVLGLAPECELHILKMIDNTGNINESAMIAAFDYCLVNNIDFINCSFSAFTNDFQSIITNLKNNNTVVICASGNGNSDSDTVYPAILDYSIAVNAIQEDEKVRYKSILGGHGIDFAASGHNQECINPFTLESYYESGTSLSAPFIVGAAAVFASKLRKIDPVLWHNNFKIIDYIKSRCTTRTPKQYFGSGTINFI